MNTMSTMNSIYATISSCSYHFLDPDYTPVSQRQPLFYLFPTPSIQSTQNNILTRWTRRRRRSTSTSRTRVLNSIQNCSVCVHGIAQGDQAGGHNACPANNWIERCFCRNEMNGKHGEWHWNINNWKSSSHEARRPPSNQPPRDTVGGGAGEWTWRRDLLSIVVQCRRRRKEKEEEKKSVQDPLPGDEMTEWL